MPRCLGMLIIIQNDCIGPVSPEVYEFMSSQQSNNVTIMQIVYHVWEPEFKPIFFYRNKYTVLLVILRKTKQKN